MNANDGVIEFYSRLITGIGPGNGRLWMGNINVVPKRGLGGRKKLSTGAQQKTHAY